MHKMRNLLFNTPPGTPMLRSLKVRLNCSLCHVAITRSSALGDRSRDMGTMTSSMGRHVIDSAMLSFCHFRSVTIRSFTRRRCAVSVRSCFLFTSPHSQYSVIALIASQSTSVTQWCRTHGRGRREAGKAIDLPLLNFELSENCRKCC